MEIREIKDYTEIKEEQDTILVLGYFDGLHLGHKALFEKARELAVRDKLKVVVLTFNESPRLAFVRFQPELLLHLTSPQKRHEKFAQYGVDKLYLLNFTTRFSQLSAAEFIQNYIEALRAKTVVIGFDYKFGHDRAGGDYLEQYFKGRVVTVPEVQKHQKKISSTQIRQLLNTGDVAQANDLLGYEFSTRGLVVHGDARGRTIGFPTANLAPLDRTFLPADGVYVSDVLINGSAYRSMTSIGKNITFGGTELRLEVHIFDFEEDIYGESLEIIWLEKIRDMIKFESIDALVAQLHSDKERALNWKKDSQEG
ncbi:bifunctional riboflavin kinase/FAD synthetase [Streptococcus chenjunshii]|uniref:Riboflavin biosynthesis protein n=1 Tax=Streptococcus chenjunshii TaxID=2173853 RepID=A0A372KNZ6_9STRE|nr:bifunctional riboflavin kinase/FAD synthetase [Streptococcus chenjunshii]AXQ78739.1 bifunctional riboflavin kinase/FAD synthetase [Streptococcus chenjunshii]RFU51668.1 bifunctional riboflavin kinase/FAD synthetase [Streptococcus chenjunshii]RFU53989.1 bifunctional riboflavin kinase/FAD synthetase [Streptococcus chenjunshii]